MTLKTILFWALIVWGAPLGWLRASFREKVYNDPRWILNIKPVFVKEIKALFGTLYPNDESYIHLRNIYRGYLLMYGVLWGVYLCQ